MRDICKYLVLLPVQNEYPAHRFTCQNFEIKWYYNNQKVQVADEIMRDICKYLVSSDVADDGCYNLMNCIILLPVQNKYPATRFICQNFDKQRYIDNQKAQVADEIKRDIC